ncbi:MAG TPA: hypothetical protein VIG77_04850 [Ktedonobacterales bacterium]|jgi:hypothetical protein
MTTDTNSALNPGQPAEERVDARSARKLTEFARIEDEFTASFIFVQEVHGQRRFETFPLEHVVRYLHALYICELKDRLLSVMNAIDRYEGERCLRLLRGWQQGETAEVIAFIHRKLDNLPFGEVSRQIEQAARNGDAQTASRLAAGRVVLLNRNFNLSHALHAIITPEPEQLRAEVIALCAQLDHTPTALDQQIASLSTELYAYAPSAALARRNMLLMNRLGVQVDGHGARPATPPTGDAEERAALALTAPRPAPPYAEEVIPGQMTLVSLNWIGASKLMPPSPALPLADPSTTAPAPDA